MGKRQNKAKRSALDASLSDVSSLASGEQTSTQQSDECVDRQEKDRSCIINTPRISDQWSSTRMWSKLSDKIDKQHDLMRELYESTCKQINECEKRILQSFDGKLQIIEKEISCFRDKLSALETVTDEINKQRKELDTVMNKIDQLQSNNNINNSSNLELEIKNLKLKLQRQENNTVASDLRINGIPYMENEDLFGIFKSICETINSPTPAIKTIFRLSNRNNKRDNVSPDAVILVRMWCPYDKNYFLKTLSSFKKVNNGFQYRLSHIGFNSNNTFFVNENLTQTNYQILQAAIRLKRQKRLHSAFTIRGIVYVKKNQEGSAYRIDDGDQLADLDTLFRDPNANETFPYHYESDAAKG